MTAEIISKELFCRKLTDKPRDEKPSEIAIVAAENESINSENSSAHSAEIAQGNRGLLPVFKTISKIENEFEFVQRTKRARTESITDTNENGHVPETNNGNFIIKYY